VVSKDADMTWSSLSEISRRNLLRDAAALAASLGMAKKAHAAGEPFRVLGREQAAAIEALGDTILPGASAAGLVHFLDAQLAKPPEQALLTLRYMDVAPPYAAFYAAAAAALDAESRRSHDAGFATLGADERARIVAAMSAGGDLPDWSGPPPPLVYFVLRSDALDVFYGTISGFALLDIPYMPHIAPTQPW
jgi:Gluconate 2-dehydrogenase subunit 3